MKTSVLRTALKLWMVAGALAGLGGVAFAQSASGLIDGQTFANKLQPSSKLQIVNPAGVGQAWNQNSALPNTVPSNLGGFSQPVDGLATYTSAKTVGLSSLGSQAQIDCLNHIPGQGDLYKDQACAAVNFLTNRCIAPSTGEGKVLSAASLAFAPAGNCNGSYGQAVKQFGYQDAINPKDSMFGVMANLHNNIAAAQDTTLPPVLCGASSTGTPGPVTLNTCTTDGSSDLVSCSQNLSTTIITTQSAPTASQVCTNGVMVNGYCEATTTAPADPIYSCPAGYTMDASGTSCSETLTTTASPIYSCAAGETLIGSSCFSTAPATVASYSCPAGYALDASGTNCAQTITSPANPVYSCPAGYSLDASGTNCSETLTSAATPIYSCPAGETLSGSTCISVNNVSTPAQVAGFSCPAGQTVSGSNCVQVLTLPASVASYTCPAGQILSGSSCLQTINVAATVTGYTCPAGQTLSGSSCLITNPASVTGYTCPAGQALSGSSCTSTTTVAATLANYTCPAGQTLSGSTCSSTSTTTTAATPTYSCPAGQSLINGQFCSQENVVAGTANYSCPPGQTLSGSSCIQTTTSTPTMASPACPSPTSAAMVGYVRSDGTVNVMGTFANTAFYDPAVFTSMGLIPKPACTKTGISGPVDMSTGVPRCNASLLLAFLGRTYPGIPTSSYSAWSGIPYATGICVYGVAIDNPPVQTCGAGSTLSNGQCVTTITTVATIGSYSCPANYNWDSVRGMCVQTVVSSATVSYSCPAGQSLSGSTCTQTVVTTTPATPVYSCPAGYSMDASGTSCSQTQVSAATPVYSCPAGYNMDASGTSCTATSAATPVYSCPAGFNMDASGTSCSQTLTSAATPVYACPAGYSMDASGTSCSQSVVTVATPVYSCPAGDTLSGSNCISQSNVVTPANIASYSCPAGQTLSGSTCTQVLNVAASVSSYTCPAGQTLSGSSCLLVVTVAATPVYSCPAGQVLSGTTCNSTVPATIASYSCPAGFNLGAGNLCTQVLTQAATISGYSCPAGATLSGSTCTTVTVTPTTTQYSCVDGSAPIAGICYIKQVQAVWVNGCTNLETSAGQPLPTHP